MLKKYPDRIEMVTGDYKIMDGAWLLGHKTKDLGSIGEREKMYRKT